MVVCYLWAHLCGVVWEYGETPPETWNKPRTGHIAAGHRRTLGTSDAKGFKILAQVKGKPGIAVYALFRLLDGVVLNLFVRTTRRLKWNNDVTWRSLDLRYRRQRRLDRLDRKKEWRPARLTSMNVSATPGTPSSILRTSISVNYLSCESVCEFFDLPTTDNGNALYHLMEKSEARIQ